MSALRFLTCVRACIFVSVCVCVCVCMITHAVISGKPPFTLAEMKGFPLSQSSFFVSMVLWFCQNPRENRGGRKKKSMSPITNSSLSLAGCRHASTHANACIHRQWETQKQKKKLPLWLKSVYLIFFTKEVDSSIYWTFLIIAAWKDPERSKWRSFLHFCNSPEDSEHTDSICVEWEEQEVRFTVTCISRSLSCLL